MINSKNAELTGQTVSTQSAMLTAGITTYRTYLEAGGETPSIIAGHSLGEYTALTVAGTLGSVGAVKLVRLRAELMQSVISQNVDIMAATLGLEDGQVRATRVEAAQGEVVETINFSSPGQVMITDSTVAVERAMAVAKEAGTERALSLPVSVPSYCSLMKPAVERLAEALKDITIEQPQIRAVHNAGVISYDDADEIKDALVHQLYSPVR